MINLNHKRYVNSPYLRYIKEENNHIAYNFLDNNIHIINKDDKNILDYCKTPRTLEELSNLYNIKRINQMIVNRFLLLDDHIWDQESVTNLEIETSTMCNWACNYCPASFYKRTPQKIEMDLYKYILDKAYEFGKIKTVSIQSYNEPSIDNRFFEYIK